MNEARWLRIALLVLFLFFLPFVILGEGHFLVIHDYLDSNLAHIKAIKDAGAWFDREAVLPILGGVSRGEFGSPLNLKYLFFATMPLYWASVANLLLIKLTALLGMFLLLRCRILKGRSVEAAALGSIAFMLVPFYPDYGISSAGIPLLAWAFFELFDRESGIGLKTAAFAAVAYYGAYSSLVLSGAFAGLVLTAAFIIVFIREKRFCVPAFAALVLLGGLYVIGNWWLFESFFGGGTGEVMHRVEFATPGISLIGEMFATLAISQYHAGAFPAILILAAFILTVRKCRTVSDGRRNAGGWLVLSLEVLAALIAAGYLSEVLLSKIQLFREFQFSRFYFLYPALGFAILGYVIDEMLRRGRKKLARVLFALVAVYGIALDSNVTNDAERMIAGTMPSYRDFYDPGLFDDVREAIALDGCCEARPRVACLGFMPAVAEYNGFWTADAYMFSYPLEYKHAWREVIAGELAKDEGLAAYFDEWGSRCYLFASELGSRPNWGKRKWTSGSPLTDLKIDTAALSGLGCRYVLSAVPIPSPESLGLTPLAVCEGGWWKIHLYRI